MMVLGRRKWKLEMVCMAWNMVNSLCMVLPGRDVVSHSDEQRSNDCSEIELMKRP